MPKKGKLTARLTVRIPPAVLRSLRADAKHHQRSVSQRVLHALYAIGHPLKDPEFPKPA